MAEPFAVASPRANLKSEATIGGKPVTAGLNAYIPVK